MYKYNTIVWFRCRKCFCWHCNPFCRKWSWDEWYLPAVDIVRLLAISLRLLKTTDTFLTIPTRQRRSLYYECHYLLKKMIKQRIQMLIESNSFFFTDTCTEIYRRKQLNHRDTKKHTNIKGTQKHRHTQLHVAEINTEK